MIPLFQPGYIDPGSGLQFFSFLGTFLAAMLGALGFLLWPFKRVREFFLRGGGKAKAIGVIILLGIAAIAMLVVYKSYGGKGGIVNLKKLPRVIVIGIDGMDPQITDALMEKGGLPNFAKLARTGTFQRIQTTNPAQSPVAWSTVSTGSNPGEHGLFDFIWRHEENYLPDLSLAKLEPPERTWSLFGHKFALGAPRYRSHRGGIPFWDLTSKQGIPTYVLRYPLTFPPEPVSGSMLSGMGVPDLRGGQGTFSFYTSAQGSQSQVQGGLVIPVTGDKNRYETHLIGPRGAQGQDISIPVRIKVNPDKRTAEIQVSGEKVILSERSWSHWVRVKFPIDVFTHLKAMCRFYLKSLENPFELYCSPMNFDPREPVFPISYKNDYARKLQEAIGDFHTIGMPHDTWALNEGRMDEEMFLSQTDTIVTEERAMVLHELEKFESGLLVAVFESLDRIQHMFWRYRDKESPLYSEEGAKKYGSVIEEYYHGMDRILGEILKFVDDRTTLLITSDHGFTHFRRAVHLNAWLRDQGLLYLKENMQEGKPLFRDVDWSRTKAYAVGLGSVYVNLKGRESHGIVGPGAEKDEIERAIINGLEQLVDSEKGGRIVYKVYRRDEIFAGSRLEKMPDLVVAFVPGYRVSWQTALGASPQAIIEDNLKKWSGDHIVDPLFVPGVFVSNKKFYTEGGISLYDVAPTILSLFKIQAPKAYIGQPLRTERKEVVAGT